MRRRRWDGGTSTGTGHQGLSATPRGWGDAGLRPPGPSLERTLPADPLLACLQDPMGAVPAQAAQGLSHGGPRNQGGARASLCRVLCWPPVPDTSDVPLHLQSAVPGPHPKAGHRGRPWPSPPGVTKARRGGSENVLQVREGLFLTLRPAHETSPKGRLGEPQEIPREQRTRCLTGGKLCGDTPTPGARQGHDLGEGLPCAHLREWIYASHFEASAGPLTCVLTYTHNFSGQWPSELPWGPQRRKSAFFCDGLWKPSIPTRLPALPEGQGQEWTCIPCPSPLSPSG